MTYLREHIVACGIPDRPVTSLAEEGVHVPMRDVVDVVARLAEERWGDGAAERQDVAWRHRVDDLSLFSRGAGPGEPVRLASRLAAAGVTAGLSIESPQARVAAPQGPPRPRGAGAQADDPRPRPGDGLRGRRLPEPVGVLGRRHGDVHGARRAVHPGLRVLPRRHEQAAGAGRRRAGARRRGHRPHGPRPRRADDGRPRRPGRRRDGPRRGLRRGDPGPPARHPRRDADLRRPGRRRRRSSCCSPSGPTSSTTTWRPSPGCSGPCARRPATPAACRCWPGPRRPG